MNLVVRFGPGGLAVRDTAVDGGTNLVRAGKTNVEMVDDYLTITAARKSKEGEKEQSFSFSRSVTIPDAVQADKVAAAYENGVLTVTLPKREEAKPRKISINVN